MHIFIHIYKSLYEYPFIQVDTIFNGEADIQVHSIDVLFHMFVSDIFSNGDLRLHTSASDDETTATVFETGSYGTVGGFLKNCSNSLPGLDMFCSACDLH